MSTSPKIFQLTMVSQNDGGCPCGSQLTGEVLFCIGGTLNEKRSNPFKMHHSVKLPIPPPPAPPPSPTWFFDLGPGGIDEFFVVVKVAGPAAEKGPTYIPIRGVDLPGWVKQNTKLATNQIYKTGDCGIFGFAQESSLYWIYTVTAGVTNPEVHP